MKKICLIGVIINHHTLYKYIINILLNNNFEIFFITKTKILKELYFNNNTKLKIKEDNRNLDVIYKSNLDIINDSDVFITDEYNGPAIKLYNLKFNARKNILIVHNVNKWTRFIYNPFIKEFYDQFFKFNLRRQFDAYVTIAPNIKQYFLKEDKKKPVFFIPFDYQDNIIYDNQINNNDDVIITIPGTVNQKRRNYFGVLNTFQEYLFNNYKTKIKLCLLGKIYNKELLEFVKKINLKYGNRIEYWESFIPNNVFEKKILNSNFILTNLNINQKIGYINEYYGISKESGFIFIAYKYAKPIILQSDYHIDSLFKNQCIVYNSFSDLKSIFYKIETKVIENELKEKAKVNRIKFNNLIFEESQYFLNFINNKLTIENEDN